MEPKPAWQTVPSAVKRLVAQHLGVSVARATRIWGGYGPTPTFRLLLQDGQRAFFKGTNAASNGFMLQALDIEERAYTTLGELMASWAPAFFGAFRHQDWHVLLLEDLGGTSVLPWSAHKARAAAHGLAAFHATTLGKRLPRWLRRDSGDRWGCTWHEAEHADGGLDTVAALAGVRAPEAREWLAQHAARLKAEAERLEQTRRPYALLHMDARSDNMRLHAGRLRLFDWPFVCVGAPELEMALFAQSVATEGGPPPERVMAWYAERAPVRERVLDASVAAIPGFFGGRGRLPDIPGLPRVRQFQRNQFKTTLRWAARRFELPEPSWLAGIPLTPRPPLPQGEREESPPR